MEVSHVDLDKSIKWINAAKHIMVDGLTTRTEGFGGHWNIFFGGAKYLIGH